MKSNHLFLKPNSHSQFKGLKYYLLLVLIIYSQVVFAQTKDVKLDIISNTPRHITSLTVGYKYGANFDNPLVFSNNIDVCFHATRFNLNINYEWPIKWLYDSSEYDLTNVTNPLFQKIEVAASFGLWTGVKDETIDVEWSGGYNKVWSTYVPVKSLKVKGIHTGFTTKNSIIEVNDKYYDYNNYSCFLGYFWSKYSAYDFTVEDRIRKTGFRYHISYLDAFYSPPNFNQFIADSTEYLPFGARFGSHVYSLRHVGFSFRIEFGVLPKNFTSNSSGNNIAYYYIKFGVGINGTLRKLGKEYDY